ncbi:hypothetical protein UA74_14835 [Actinoalloteichus fjordicus]|uniref:NAD(P)-binding domain-containing protein n=2 Tax=Actinoalloteichus fjordicus TaxID=1612552 RepID=A0AAC9PSD5_9PSEU|nr:hypothetical protein UA74_14835 [Actinoalloteichus fjordicus]
MVDAPRTMQAQDMTHDPVLVIGGTGKTGRRVTARLEAADIPVRVASRSGTTHFDWLDETTWDAALTGVTAAYLVPLDGANRTGALIRRAEELGVPRLVLLSARGVDTPGYFGADNLAGEGHLAGEAALRDSDTDWTILRPGWFAQNFSAEPFLTPIRQGELRLPAADGAATFIDVEDIAEVAVTALTAADDAHTGATYELSGPRPLTIAEALAEIAAATGHQARYVPIPVEDFIADLVAQGAPAAEAEIWAAGLTPIRENFEARVSDGVHRALGREPRDFTDYVAAAAAAGALWGSGPR